MAAVSRIGAGAHLTTRLGPGFFNGLLLFDSRSHETSVMFVIFTLSTS